MEGKLPGKDTQFSGSIKQHHHLPKINLPKVSGKKKVLIIGLVVSVVVVVVGVYFWHVKQTSHNEDKRYATVIQQVDANVRVGDQKKAQKLLEDFLATNPKDTNHLYNVEIRLATIYQFNNDYQNARIQGEASLKHTNQPTLDTYIILGESCQKLKDYKAAVGYYQKAVEILKNDPKKLPSNNAQIQYLSASIASMVSQEQQ